MKKIFCVLGLCLCATCVLSGCSLFSRSTSASDAEAFAKAYINDRVESTGGKKKTEKTFSGKEYYFPMADDRGIEFNVIVYNRKTVLVEAFTPFYGKNLYYTTDYKLRVIEHYKDEIEAVLKTVSTVDYKFLRDSVSVNLTEENSLEDIASLVIALDELLAYDYRSDARSGEELGDHRYLGSSYNSDILITMRGSDNEWVIFEPFILSDNHRIQLTYDKVLKTLELNRVLMTSDTKPGIIQVNGELYYDSGEVTKEEKTGEMDGISRHTDLVPQRDGESTFGYGSEYQLAPDGTLYVFMEDGRHVFLKY